MDLLRRERRGVGQTVVGVLAGCGGVVAVVVVVRVGSGMVLRSCLGTIVIIIIVISGWFGMRSV